MVEEMDAGALQKKPTLPWGVKVKKRLKMVAPFLGKFRPSVGQSCLQCTPDSLGNKQELASPSLGFHNVLAITETQTRVQEALSAEHGAPVGGRGLGESDRLLPYRTLITTCISPCMLRVGIWVFLKALGAVFSSIQVNLNHLAALRRASQQGSPLVYVVVRQSIMDYVLIPLVLFSHNLRVPYTFCPLQINCRWLRSVLHKVGVVILPPNTLTEEDAELDNIYSPVMTALLRELLSEGQALTVSMSGESGQGGQWLARLRQVIREEAVPDVSLVPVGISYDCIPNASRQEMCDSGRCRVDGWRPLQDLLLPTILYNRTDAIFGQKMMSWILPSHYAPELTQSERDLSTALTLHLIYTTTSCMAVMSTSLVSSILLHRHRKGLCVSALCRDVVWLTEELLFRNKDVGFGGRLPEVVCYALALLGPHLTIAASPCRNDPYLIPGPSMDAILSLSIHAQFVTHSFIAEAVGACAVSAMLCEVASSGVSSRVRSGRMDSEEVKGDMEFDLVLCETQLSERALQLCHLLPLGFLPPCQSSYSFALEAVDSLVRCGVLVMEETSDVPICDFWKKRRGLSWPTTDDPYNSDSDCEEREARSYKLSQPSQCPEMLLFLCSMLAGHLRALCWATDGVQYLRTPMSVAECVAQIHSHLCKRAKEDKHYESCTEEAARTAVRTLRDLGVLVDELQSGTLSLVVSSLFQIDNNRQKLQDFISQHLYS